MLTFFCSKSRCAQGKLKSGKEDDRIFLKKLQNLTNDIKFDLYGVNNIQPFGQIIILRQYRMLKWG